MLPEVRLDTENFDDMVLEMRNMLASIDPEWTNYNAHDPGITLMELAAWFEGIQHYHMDQIGDRQLVRYLGLLGEKKRGRRAAKTLLEIRGEEPVQVKAGTRFYAGKFCFETMRGRQISGQSIQVLGSEERGCWTFMRRQQLQYGGRMEFYPFGKKAEPGSAFYIGLSEPVKPGNRQELSILVSENYPVKRNPISEGFLPLVLVEFQYRTRDGWEPAVVLRDETFGFLKTGFLLLRVEKDMEPYEISGETRYWLRAVLKEGTYETAPILTGLSFDHFLAVQKETRAFPVDRETEERDGQYVVRTVHFLAETGEAEAFLRYGDRFVRASGLKRLSEGGETVFLVEKGDGKRPDGVRILIWEPEFSKKRRLPDGTGFPEQEIDLEDLRILPESFELMAEDMESPGTYRVWTRVEDFGFSGPGDLHYVLDEETGRLFFGDGFHGLAPEGRLLLSGCGDSWGKEGNINKSPMTAEEGLQAGSLSDAWGGADVESLDGAFLRVMRSLGETDRAVSLSDYERLAKRTPGLMIKSCRAVALGDQTVLVAVMPWSESGAGSLSPRAVKNIQSFLDSRRMIGTKVLVTSPDYIQITVAAEVVILPQFRDGKQFTEKEVRDFFEEQKEKMGEPLQYRSLYGLFDRMEWIGEIRSLSLEARGNRFRRNGNGDVIPPPDGVFLLKRLECIVCAGMGPA